MGLRDTGTLVLKPTTIKKAAERNPLIHSAARRTRRGAGLHDFTACLLQLRVLVELLRKAGQRLLGTLKMFAQVIVASSVFIPFLRRIERQ